MTYKSGWGKEGTNRLYVFYRTVRWAHCVNCVEHTKSNAGGIVTPIRLRLLNMKASHFRFNSLPNTKQKAKRSAPHAIWTARDEFRFHTSTEPMRYLIIIKLEHIQELIYHESKCARKRHTKHEIQIRTIEV